MCNSEVGALRDRLALHPFVPKRSILACKFGVDDGEEVQEGAQSTGESPSLCPFCRQISWVRCRRITECDLHGLVNLFSGWYVHTQYPRTPIRRLPHHVPQRILDVRLNHVVYAFLLRLELFLFGYEEPYKLHVRTRVGVVSAQSLVQIPRTTMCEEQPGVGPSAS